eukprot:5780456-Amphidinium_carterae.1
MHRFGERTRCRSILCVSREAKPPFGGPGSKQLYRRLGPLHQPRSEPARQLSKKHCKRFEDRSASLLLTVCGPALQNQRATAGPSQLA